MFLYNVRDGSDRVLCGEEIHRGGIRFPNPHPPTPTPTPRHPHIRPFMIGARFDRMRECFWVVMKNLKQRATARIQYYRNKYRCR